MCDQSEYNISRRITRTGYRRIPIAKIWSCVWLAVFVLVFVNGKDVVEPEPPIIDTTWGQIRGKWSKSLAGWSIANYLGIPYALPPVGDLRFKNPQPWNRRWTTTRNATSDGQECVQLGNPIYGNEDCLYLNIFVPKIPNSRQRSAKLAVLVFLHGGSYLAGSSDSNMYSPKYLVEKDIILVTLNYRLNILGFFSTGNRVSPGNYAIKDMVMALKWIKENIRNFYGNPESVTLMGNSAGSAAAHLLALSRKTEGLFHKYIMLSGSANAPWNFHPREKYRQTCLNVARQLGCLPGKGANDQIDDHNLQTDEEMMSCMRALSLEKLVSAFTKFAVWNYHPGCIFGPTSEEESEDAILTMHPIKALKDGLFRDIPVIMQVVKDEGLALTLELYQSEKLKNELSENFERYVPYLLEYNEVISDTHAFGQDIQNFYFNGNATANLLSNVTDMAGDATIIWPMYETLQYQSQRGNSAIYFSLFAFEGTLSNSLYLDRTKYYGVHHADDLGYLFPMLNSLAQSYQLNTTMQDDIMIDLMADVFTNFMKTSVPITYYIPVWPNYRDGHKYIRIGQGQSPNILIQENFLNDRMEFWKKMMNRWNAICTDDMRYA